MEYTYVCVCACVSACVCVCRLTLQQDADADLLWGLGTQRIGTEVRTRPSGCLGGPWLGDMLPDKPVEPLPLGPRAGPPCRLLIYSYSQAAAANVPAPARATSRAAQAAAETNVSTPHPTVVAT